MGVRSLSQTGRVNVSPLTQTNDASWPPTDGCGRRLPTRFSRSVSFFEVTTALKSGRNGDSA
ncbi:hypothetical protein, partial [Burkholderia vietnamiensis]|uniref:hypothetical protein n=1 Tax=Burkholderia vietnamiensis TaxID=60552 RepID=UPI001E4C2C69